ncbi:hypothetical protein JCM5296_005829 [Sporobolomyces johnsonii]
MPPDSYTNRPLLYSVFVFAAVLFYLSSHRPSSSQPHQHLANPKQPTPVPPVPTQLDSPQRGNGVLTHRIVAVGDIHGDYPALTKILRRAGLIDLRGSWIGGSDLLVQTGDIVDRGVDTIACYRFMQSLRPQAEKAGGGVVSLLGNHEIMNALGDWRYVNPADVKSFGGERNRREAMLTGWIGQEWRHNYSITARLPYLFSSFPSPSLVPTFPATPAGSSDQRFLGEPLSPSHSSHSDDYDEEASLDGSSSNPFSHAAASFVHGGITPEYLDSLSTSSPISQINAIGRSLLYSLLSAPQAPLSLPRGATPEQREFWSERGPMWNREWALEDEDEELCARVERVCKKLKVRRLVMGHTPHFEGIVSRCAGRVLLIDTGISRAYGGSLSSLEIVHTLTPRSHLSFDEALSFGLIDLQSPEEGEKDTVWIEREVIKALYTDGREDEELVRMERVVEVPQK